MVLRPNPPEVVECTNEKSIDCHLLLWREGKDNRRSSEEQVVEFFLDLDKVHRTQWTETINSLFKTDWFIF